LIKNVHRDLRLLKATPDNNYKGNTQESNMTRMVRVFIEMFEMVNGMPDPSGRGSKRDKVAIRLPITWQKSSLPEIP